MILIILAIIVIIWIKFRYNFEDYGHYSPTVVEFHGKCKNNKFNGTIDLRILKESGLCKDPPKGMTTYDCDCKFTKYLKILAKK